MLILHSLEDAEELLVKRANIWSGRASNRLVNDMYVTRIGLPYCTYDTVRRMQFGWAIIQLQPSHDFYEMRKVFRKVIGPNNVSDYDHFIEKESGELVRGLAGFTGNPLPRLYEYVKLGDMDSSILLTIIQLHWQDNRHTCIWREGL